MISIKNKIHKIFDPLLINHETHFDDGSTINYVYDLGPPKDIFEWKIIRNHTLPKHELLIAWPDIPTYVDFSLSLLNWNEK